jgi:acyl transferase domain-containing protein
MRARRVFMFAGQGSQYSLQMGRGLYDEGGSFTRWMQHIDAIVRDAGSPPVLALLYDKRSKAGPVYGLRASHPAIFMVESALARHVMECGVEPELTLSANLGTAATAVLVAALNMEDALRWMVRQSAFLADTPRAACPSRRCRCTTLSTCPGFCRMRTWRCRPCSVHRWCAARPAVRCSAYGPTTSGKPRWRRSVSMKI